MTINLNELFEQGFISNWIPNTTAQDVISELGSPIRIESQDSFKNEGGEEVFPTQLVYKDIKIYCYNDLIERISVDLRGDNNTKNLSIIGYAECKSRTRKQWHIYLCSNGWDVKDDEYSGISARKNNSIVNKPCGVTLGTHKDPYLKYPFIEPPISDDDKVWDISLFSYCANYYGDWSDNPQAVT